MLAVACAGGSGSEGAGGTPGSGIEEGPDFVVEGVDPTVLCPDATVLTADFILSNQGLVDNTFAAQGVPDPQRREQEYQEWGRVTGYFAQWRFVSPSALTAEELSRLSEEEAAAARERARQEALANPFLSATCSVALFETAEGAAQAFAVETAEARDPRADPASGFAPGVDERPGPDVGSESIDIVYRYPTFDVFLISIRTRNVIGSLSVIASSTSDTTNYAEVLATAFMDRLDDTLEPAG